MKTSSPDPQHFFRLAYVSHAVKRFSPAELRHLEEHAQRNNSGQNIHGVLLTDDSAFLQVLEGPEDAVKDLMCRIWADPRHERVHVFAEEQEVASSFQQWSMSLIDMERRPAALQETFRSMFRIFENTPVRLRLDEKRIRFFQQLATW